MRAIHACGCTIVVGPQHVRRAPALCGRSWQPRMLCALQATSSVCCGPLCRACGIRTADVRPIGPSNPGPDTKTWLNDASGGVWCWAGHVWLSLRGKAGSDAQVAALCAAGRPSWRGRVRRARRWRARTARYAAATAWPRPRRASRARRAAPRRNIPETACRLSGGKQALRGGGPGGAPRAGAAPAAAPARRPRLRRPSAGRARGAHASDLAQQAQALALPTPPVSSHAVFLGGGKG